MFGEVWAIRPGEAPLILDLIGQSAPARDRHRLGGGGVGLGKAAGGDPVGGTPTYGGRAGRTGRVSKAFVDEHPIELSPGKMVSRSRRRMRGRRVRSGQSMRRGQTGAALLLGVARMARQPG